MAVAASGRAAGPSRNDASSQPRAPLVTAFDETSSSAAIAPTSRTDRARGCCRSATPGQSPRPARSGLRRPAPLCERSPGRRRTGVASSHRAAHRGSENGLYVAACTRTAPATLPAAAASDTLRRTGLATGSRSRHRSRAPSNVTGVRANAPTRIVAGREGHPDHSGRNDPVTATATARVRRGCPSPAQSAMPASNAVTTMPATPIASPVGPPATRWNPDWDRGRSRPRAAWWPRRPRCRQQPRWRPEENRAATTSACRSTRCPHGHSGPVPPGRRTVFSSWKCQEETPYRAVGHLPSVVRKTRPRRPNMSSPLTRRVSSRS